MSATVVNPSQAHPPESIFARLPALLEAPLSYVRGARSRRRRQALEREHFAARLKLGKKMFAAGIDDGETGALITALDHDLLRATLAGRPREWLELHLETLLLRLADAALENDAPLPGADAEFAHALDSQRSVAAEAARASA